MFDYPSSLFDLDYGDSVFEPFNAIEDTLYSPQTRNYGYQQQQRNRRPYQQSLQRSPYQQQYGQQGSQLATQQPQQMQQNRQLGTQIQNDQNQFSVALDCRHFNPNEIEVTYGDNNSVQIHGKHEERSDEHGFISREFNRRYVLPRECELDKLNASWNENGQLQISCPKQPQQRQIGQGRKVPIQGIENYQPRQSQLQQGQSQYGQQQQGQQYGQQFLSGQQQGQQSHQGQQVPISTSADQPKSSFELSSGQKDQTKSYGSQAQSDVGGRSPSDMDIDQKSPQIGSQSDFPELNKESQHKGKESVTSGLGSDIGKESSKHDAQKTTEKTSAIRG
jgi:HSP20 family molecular chaperone IbpA